MAELEEIADTVFLIGGFTFLAVLFWLVMKFLGMA